MIDFEFHNKHIITQIKKTVNTQKQWQVSPKISPDVSEAYPEINGIILQLLFNRGLTSREAINEFLEPNFSEHLFDPFLFTDMAKAVKRLFSAVDAGEKVMIYGDYDADGVCSTVLLHEALKGLGLDVDIYIPFRETEGYGLNPKVVQQIIREKFQLVITVDCGVANHDEIKDLQASGIDVIILDHHEEPLKLPPAYALINPNIKSCGYPESRLCGAGVAFKFIQAIVKWQEQNDCPIKLPDGFEKWLLDLVAIATVGDIVPLVKENRILVKYGLVVLEKTKNIGLKLLMESVNNRFGGIDTEYLGWRLVPRINAAGRINHASAAFYLLTATSDEEALKWVNQLEENNKHRQQLTESIMKQSEEQLKELTEEMRAIIVVGEGWPVGVVGLAAGRLSDKYHRPALVFSKGVQDGTGEVKYVASGRSIEEFDITEALKECAEYLLRYGGHPQACGLTIIGEENFARFKEKFSALAGEKLMGVELVSVLEIEAEIKLADLNWRLMDELLKMEPFGESNRRPLLMASKLNVEQVQTVGADGKHLKVLVSQDGDINNLHKLIGFSFGDWCAKLTAGDKIDIVFELGVNEWNGNRELQLKITDLKLSEK